MDIKDKLIGTWKQFRSDNQMTIGPNLTLSVNHGASKGKNLILVVSLNTTFNKYQIIAPQIGLNHGIINSLTDEELIIDSLDAPGDLVVDSITGEFLEGFTRFVFNKVW